MQDCRAMELCHARKEIKSNNGIQRDGDMCAWKVKGGKGISNVKVSWREADGLERTIAGLILVKWALSQRL